MMSLLWKKSLHCLVSLLLLSFCSTSEALQPYQNPLGPQDALADPFHLEQRAHGREEEHGYKIMDQGLAPNADKVKMFPPMPDLGDLVQSNRDSAHVPPKEMPKASQVPEENADGGPTKNILEGSIEFQNGKMIGSGNSGGWFSSKSRFNMCVLKVAEINFLFFLVNNSSNARARSSAGDSSSGDDQHMVPSPGLHGLRPPLKTKTFVDKLKYNKSETEEKEVTFIFQRDVT